MNLIKTNKQKKKKKKGTTIFVLKLKNKNINKVFFFLFGRFKNWYETIT